MTAAAFAPEPLVLDGMNMAAAWAACTPLPDGHPCRDWTLTDQARLSAVTGYEGLTALRLTDGQHLTGLALIRPDRPAAAPQIFGSGDFVPAPLPAGDVLLLTVQPETAAAIAATDLPAVACLTPARIEAAMLHWRGRYGHVLIPHSIARIDEIPPSLRDLVLPLDDLPDLSSTAQNVRADLLAALDEWRQARPSPAWPAPRGYGADTAAATPYPLDAMPPLAREAAAAIAQHVQAPEALAGQCVLAALAHLAQPLVNCWHPLNPAGQPCSLFLLTEGPSGSRKSTCQALANFVIAEHERAALKNWKNDFDRWQDTPTAERAAQPPLCPKTLYADATLEPVIAAFIRGLPAASLSSDEASQFFGGHAMSRETIRATIGTLTKIFDSGNAERTRSASNRDVSGTADHCRLSISLLGQREILHTALNDQMLRAQGFLPRFLLTAPDPIFGQRLYREARPYDDPRLANFWERCRALLPDVPDGLPVVIDERRDTDSRLPVLPPTEAAKKLWIEFYNACETGIGQGRRYENLAEFAIRAPENALRAATVLAFFELQTQVDEQAMRAGIALARHSLSEWRRYQIAPEADPLTQAAQRLEVWLVEKTRATDGTVDRSHVQQSGPAAARKNTQTLDACLSILTNSNRVRLEKIGRKTVIVVNPALLE